MALFGEHNVTFNLKTQPKTVKEFPIFPRLPGIHISFSLPSRVLQWQSLRSTAISQCLGEIQEETEAHRALLTHHTAVSPW